MNPTLLCLAFRIISERTWHKLRNNHISTIKISEETITEINLQDLDLLRLPYFHVIDFSKYVESNETGADWEWWFVQKDMCFGMAVQAKKINEKDNSYSIDYKPKSGPHQIERLLDYSKKMNLSPLYCFYNYWDLIDKYDTFWPCPTIEYKKESWGCSIAHGLVIYKLFKMNKKYLNDILPISHPLHCLACCPGLWYDKSKSKSFANRAIGIATQLYEHHTSFDIPLDNYSSYKEPYPTKELPERIAKILGKIRTDEPITDGFIHDFWPEQKPKSLVIIGGM